MRSWLISAALGCAGCAFQTQSVEMAIDHNEFVAQTTNQQTVLNILRARDREPMHFTRFSKVNGTVQADGDLTLPFAFNGDSGSEVFNFDDVNGRLRRSGSTFTDSFGATNLTPSLSLGIDTGTNFDITVDADEKFYRGILNPIAQATVVHYLRQGFPRDLLTHLLVRRVQFYANVHLEAAAATSPGASRSLARIPLADVTNVPYVPQAISDFSLVARCWQLDYRVDPSDPREIPIDGPTDIANIESALLARVHETTAARGAGSRFIYRLPRESLQLTLARPAVHRDTSIATMAGRIAERPNAQLPRTSPAEGEHCRNLRRYLTALFRSELRNDHPQIPLRAEEYRRVPARTQSDDADRQTARQQQFIPSDRAGVDSLQPRDGAAEEPTSRFVLEDFFKDELEGAITGDLEAEITLRSVQGMIYYLGEYIRRNPHENPYDEVDEQVYIPPLLSHSDCGSDEPYCLPIIVIARKGSEVLHGAESFVEVEHRDRTYTVPLSGGELDARHGRSSQVIALVQQLLNLHRSSENLPTTPVVRIAN